MVSLYFSRDETGSAANEFDVSGVFKSSVASGNIGRSKHYRSVMVQYCGRGNIAGAELRGHRGKGTAARRRGNSEIMMRSAVASFPDFWVTERRAAAKLKITRANSHLNFVVRDCT
jgi:hypothetical protein